MQFPHFFFPNKYDGSHLRLRILVKGKANCDVDYRYLQLQKRSAAQRSCYVTCPILLCSLVRAQLIQRGEKR